MQKIILLSQNHIYIYTYFFSSDLKNLSHVHTFVRIATPLAWGAAQFNCHWSLKHQWFAQVHADCNRKGRGVHYLLILSGFSHLIHRFKQHMAALLTSRLPPLCFPLDQFFNKCFCLYAVDNTTHHIAAGMYPFYLPLHAELHFNIQEMDTTKLLLHATLMKSTTRMYDTKILAYCTFKAVLVDVFWPLGGNVTSWNHNNDSTTILVSKVGLEC